MEAVVRCGQLFAADIGGDHQLFHAGRVDANLFAADGPQHRRREQQQLAGDQRDIGLHPRGRLHRGADLLDGIGRLEGAVVEAHAGERVVDHPILEEADQFLDVDAGFDGVLPPGVEEIVLLLALVQAGHVAVLALAVNDAGADDGELPRRVLCLPDLVDLFRHQLADAVGRIGHRDRFLGLQLLRRAVGGDGAGEQDLPDAVPFRKGGHMLGTEDVRFKIGFVRVAGRAVDRRKVEDHVLCRRCKVQRKGLTDIRADILDPFVFLHDARYDALFAGHDEIQIVDLIPRPNTLLPQQVDQVGPDEPRPSKNDVVHLFCTFSRKHDPYGFEEDADVLPKGPVVYVLHIQTNHFLEVLDVAPAADLPQAGDARLHGKAALVVALVLVVLIQRRRAGAHKAHGTAENIKKLRQFVDAGLSDEAAHLGDAGIVLHFEHQAVHFVPGHQLLLPLLGVHIHAAQLVDVEHTAVPAHAALLEDQRAGAFQLERDGHDGNDGDADDAAHKAAEDIQPALQDLVVELEFPGAHGDHIAPGTAAQHPAQPHGAGLAAARLFDPIQNRKPEMDRQAHALDLLQIRHQRIAAFRRDIDIDLIQRRLTEPVHEGIVIGLDRDTLDLAHHILGHGFQHRDAGKLLRPVLSEVLDDDRGPLPRRHDADQTPEPLGVLPAGQQLFEQRMATAHHKNVDERHCDQEIARIQHGGLGQRQARHIQQSQQRIEADRDLHFPRAAPGNDIFALVENEKGQNVGDEQHDTGFQHQPRLPEVRHLTEQAVHDQPRHRHTGHQRDKIGHKQISILQFFTSCNHKNFLLLTVVPCGGLVSARFVRVLPGPRHMDFYTKPSLSYLCNFNILWSCFQ